MLSLQYRQQQLEMRLQQVEEWKLSELSNLQDQPHNQTDPDTEDVEEEAAYIESIALQQRKDAQIAFGNAFWKNDKRISPLRGALATWGLTADDIGIASCYGRSPNTDESRILNERMRRLGRSKGNPLFAVFQKPTTGDSPAASASWSLNSGLQMLDSGLVPGSRGLRNIDDQLQQFEHILYPSRSVQTPGINAFVANAFSKGISTQVVGVHLRFLYATLEEGEFDAYARRREQRCERAQERFRRGLQENSLFVAVERPAWSEAEMEDFLLDPLARMVA